MNEHIVHMLLTTAAATFAATKWRGWGYEERFFTLLVLGPAVWTLGIPIFDLNGGSCWVWIALGVPIWIGALAWNAREHWGADDN